MFFLVGVVVVVVVVLYRMITNFRKRERGRRWNGKMRGAPRASFSHTHTHRQSDIDTRSYVRVFICLCRYAALPITLNELLLEFSGHFVRLLDGLFDASNHVESHLRQIVILAIEDSLEVRHGVLDVDILTR